MKKRTKIKRKQRIGEGMRKKRTRKKRKQIIVEGIGKRRPRRTRPPNQTERTVKCVYLKCIE